MELVRNVPLDTNIIGELISTPEDLYLVWPKARFPFDHGQWENALRTESGDISFLVYENGELIGHAALFKTDEEHKYAVGFLYIIPDLRSKGLGGKMLYLLEQYARDNLDCKKFCLVVRTYNPRAYQCYLKCGFIEDSREGTLISMSKELV